MDLSLDQWLYVVGIIFVPISIAIIQLKRKSNKTGKIDLDTLNKLEDDQLITNLQKEISEIKQKLSAYRLDSDQMNTRLSRVEGMIEVIRSRLS